MKPKVMIVDDEDVLREFVRTYLEATGYEVLEAADAAGLKASFAGPAPDVVLLDLKLPDDPAEGAAIKSYHQVARAETLANLRIHLGDLPAALSLIDALPDSPEKVLIVPRVASTLAAAGHADVGLSWVDTLSEPKAPAPTPATL